MRLCLVLSFGLWAFCFASELLPLGMFSSLDADQNGKLSLEELKLLSDIIVENTNQALALMLIPKEPSNTSQRC